MMLQWLTACCLLLCCLPVHSSPLQDEDFSSLGKELSNGAQATNREYLTVERQLIAARQVADLFTRENEQLQLYLTETKVQLATMQQVAQEEMQTAKEEVDNALEKLVRNITIWRETYHKLKATNAQNRKTLQQLRDQKQQQKEDRKRQELRKLRQQEKIREQQEKITKVATSETVWKTVVTLYLSAEQFAWGMYRQLVLPVVAIMVFFGLMTVAIARLYAAEQARRAPRVLYSGYPKNYRQKQADAAPVADAAGLRSRAERRAVPRRERNDLVGN